MPLAEADKARAGQVQQLAARDDNKFIRVVAGPGTGKSSTIEERVRWLLELGNLPETIRVVSFTRASSSDLGYRIRKYCDDKGQPGSNEVQVTTLHSLGLSALKAGGMLDGLFPATPQVLLDWEVKTIFDAEFKEQMSIGIGRARDIRTDWEARCETGIWNPPGYVPPEPPVALEERDSYQAFRRPRTRLYCCVLQGEIIHLCTERMETGTLDVCQILNIKHLIVDEYQDLNQIDTRFINLLTDDLSSLMVAGDDDQSIYSFRFAYPKGIQNFPEEYVGCGDWALQDCFRCTPQVVGAASRLIARNPGMDRIEKQLSSLYETAEPPLDGKVIARRFTSYQSEARFIGESIGNLVNGGLKPSKIAVLLSQKTLGNAIEAELERDGIAFTSCKKLQFSDEKIGPFVLSLLRIASNPDDYVAYRLLLGSLPSVGPRICNFVANAILNQGLNYKNVFRGEMPNLQLDARHRRALERARAIVAQLDEWTGECSLQDKVPVINQLIESEFGADLLADWQDTLEDIPAGSMLSESLALLNATAEGERIAVRRAILERQGLNVPDEGLEEDRVRFLTMHGAKGLSAHVVFVPGLEEGSLPNSRAIQFPGLLAESARLLYVSVTRARAVCVLTYSTRRTVNGASVVRQPSTFTSDLGTVFARNDAPLTSAEVKEIVEACALL